MSVGRKFATVVEGLIIAYAVTGVLLAALAFTVFRFHLSEALTDVAIVAIYVIVTFIGGGNTDRSGVSCDKYCEYYNCRAMCWRRAAGRNDKLR